MKDNRNKLPIIVGALLLVIGISFAYFTSTIIFDGKGAGTTGTTATINGSTVNVEGNLSFNDLDILPGHKNVSSIKVTATGGNELVPFNLVWTGTNELGTPLNYTVYKTTTNVEVSATCEQIRGTLNGFEDMLKAELSETGLTLHLRHIYPLINMTPDTLNILDGEGILYYQGGGMSDDYIIKGVFDANKNDLNKGIYLNINIPEHNISSKLELVKK